MTVSGSLALYPHDGKSWDELFGIAERGLKAAKVVKNRIVAGAGGAAGPEISPPAVRKSMDCLGELRRDRLSGQFLF